MKKLIEEDKKAKVVIIMGIIGQAAEGGSGV
jgi:hypothetical protein